MTTAAIAYEKIRSFPGINWNVVFFAGLAAMAVSAVFYALQINDLTRGSYLINSYQNRISELSETNKGLQVNFAESDFLGQALQKAEGMNFQKTTSIKYIKILDNSFAVVK